MSQTNKYDDEQNRIRRYLLGQLTEDERQLIEERIFTDPAFLTALQMTEEELMEEYVFKLLPPEENEKFASQLLVSPEQIHRFQTTTVLKKYSDGAAQKSVSPFFRHVKSRWGLAVAATLIMTVVIGIWIRRATSLERAVVALNIAGESSIDYRVELPRLRLRSEPGEDVPQQRVVIPAQVNVVQFRLPLETASYSGYEITLIREPDSRLFTLNGRSPVESGNNKVLIVRVPASALKPGIYRLILKGITAIGRVDDLGSHIVTVLEPGAQGALRSGR